jgi:hypothetical protein
VTKTFQFPVKRRARPLPGLARQPEAERVVLEEMTPIQGKMPGSREEWRVAMALDKLGLEYQYQVPVMGGRQLRGGAVVDFVVDLPPESIALLVHGQYWHTTLEEERLYLAALERIFGRPAIVLWDYDLEDVPMAIRTLRRELNL